MSAFITRKEWKACLTKLNCNLAGSKDRQFSNLTFAKWTSVLKSIPFLKCFVNLSFKWPHQKYRKKLHCYHYCKLKHQEELLIWLYISIYCYCQLLYLKDESFTT